MQCAGLEQTVGLGNQPAPEREWLTPTFWIQWSNLTLTYVAWGGRLGEELFGQGLKLRFNRSVISQGNCSERRDLRKSIVGSLDRIDYPLLSGPYLKPVSLLLICRSREQAEFGVTLPQSVRWTPSQWRLGTLWGLEVITEARQEQCFVHNHHTPSKQQYYQLWLRKCGSHHQH